MQNFDTLAASGTSNAWTDDSTFADTVALCQFLPGPASSQVGMAIGILRAGLGGALAAWTGFMGLEQTGVKGGVLRAVSSTAAPAFSKAMMSAT